MCGLGLLWKIDAANAKAALSLRDEFLETIGRHAGWRVDVDAAWIVFTEILTNVLRHGQSPVSVWLDCTGAVRLHVLESGPGFNNVPAAPKPDDKGGRGLFLASKMSAGLEIKGEPRGTLIVATLL